MGFSACPPYAPPSTFKVITMNAEERHLEEIKRLEIALKKTKNPFLKRDYEKGLIRLKEELEEYRKFRREAKC